MSLSRFEKSIGLHKLLDFIDWSLRALPAYRFGKPWEPSRLLPSPLAQFYTNQVSRDVQ